MTRHDTVRERGAMLAGLTPILKDEVYFFCTTSDRAVVTELAEAALATFQEDEGIALVLREADAARHGFDMSMPMSRIVLEVFSALDGVGLTAGVATALAAEGIPCNMIAAYHHDNVFVPEHSAHRALDVLSDLQRNAAEAMVSAA